MTYSHEVEHMCVVKKGPNHGPAPIPEEGKWVKSKEIVDISGLTHGVGWCAPQQGACKLTLNVKEGIIQEALVETIGCSGMTHSAAMAAEILPGKTLLEALNTDLVCDAINTAMRELFLQIVYGRTQSAFSEGGLIIGAGLEDLGKGLRSQVGTLYGTLAKGPRYLEMPEGYYAEGDVLHPKKVCNHISGEVREGSFRWTTEPVPGWTLSTKDAAEMKLTKEQPKFSTAPNNLKVTIKNASTPVRLINEGYWGMNLVKDNSYQLRTIIRPASDYKGKVTALLLSEQGEVLASAPVDITAAGQWNDLSLAMQPTATSAKVKLDLEFYAPGTVYVDFVSLFP